MWIHILIGLVMLEGLTKNVALVSFLQNVPLSIRIPVTLGMGKISHLS